MIQLPKFKRGEQETAGLCMCRPVCKSRRREWKGTLQKTSVELMQDRKPKTDCVRRRPNEVHLTKPCPLFGKTRRISIRQKDDFMPVTVARLCQAPIDDKVGETPYLDYAALAKHIGAWKSVIARCAFCDCGACCPCTPGEYVPRDADRAAARRSDMRQFDTRLKTTSICVKNMYDVF